MQLGRTAGVVRLGYKTDAYISLTISESCSWWRLIYAGSQLAAEELLKRPGTRNPRFEAGRGRLLAAGRYCRWGPWFPFYGRSCG